MKFGTEVVPAPGVKGEIKGSRMPLEPQLSLLGKTL